MPLFRVGAGYGCGQDGVVAAGRKGSAGGLLGDAPCLKLDVLATGKLDRHVLFHGCPLFLFCL